MGTLRQQLASQALLGSPSLSLDLWRVRGQAAALQNALGAAAWCECASSNGGRHQAKSTIDEGDGGGFTVQRQQLKVKGSGSGVYRVVAFVAIPCMVERQPIKRRLGRGILLFC
jgi:hypothetical protein